MFTYLVIAIVGILEAFLSTINSKFRQKSKQIGTFVTSFINGLVWYYLISMVIENIKNGGLIVIYATFYALGDVLGLRFDNYLDKLVKTKGFRTFKKYFKSKKK